MTNNVLIVLSCGTDNPNRSTRALHLAKVATENNKSVTIFLLDDGVYIAKKGITDNLRAATGDIADDLLVYLQEHEVPIYACTPCAKARQISKDDLVEGAQMGTAAQMLDMACNSAVISL